MVVTLPFTNSDVSYWVFGENIEGLSMVQLQEYNEDSCHCGVFRFSNIDDWEKIDEIRPSSLTLVQLGVIGYRKNLYNIYWRSSTLLREFESLSMYATWSERPNDSESDAVANWKEFGF